MKKILSILLVSLLCLSVVFSFTACTQTNTEQGTSTPTPTPLPPDIDPATVDVIGTTWQVTELSFETDKKYSAASGEQGKLEFYGEFKHKESGKTLTIPGFWDGGKTFKIRFAPTAYGVWEYKTICEEDANLAGKTGTIGANAYKGDLEIYKHGFVKTETGKKYFVYDDGTPFFYIGDTHWGMMMESFDSAGEDAGSIQTNSHFKYIVDKRVEQGYTVYQSQSGNTALNLVDARVNTNDIEHLQNIDRYFNYIAEKGLIHPHTQCGLSAAAVGPLVENYEGLENLARYWVARYGAYPVMWTLAQECDNDFYYELDRQNHTTVENSVWIYLAEYINKYDAYNHPTTAHQEAYPYVSASGAGTSSTASNNGTSAFFNQSVTDRTGHDWWGTQWNIKFDNPSIPVVLGKDYWATSKVAVLYEGSYAYLYTKDFGARAQGWLAYLNGFFGYGYGAQDIWAYKNAYGSEGNTSDGLETVTPTDKKKKWSETIELPSGYQVGYMRQFFEKFEWWSLVPDFDNKSYFFPSLSRDSQYAVATKGNDIYVCYFYSSSARTGTLCKLDGDATYTMKWFNPRTNEYIEIGNNIKSNAVGGAGEPAYIMDNKPNNSSEDWVFLAIKNK